MNCSNCDREVGHAEDCVTWEAPVACAHRSVAFPKTSEAANALLSRMFTVEEIHMLWPRFSGRCSCGYEGIAYASLAHYVAGDW